MLARTDEVIENRCTGPNELLHEGQTMKRLLLLALLLTLAACQNPSRLQAVQSGHPQQSPHALPNRSTATAAKPPLLIERMATMDFRNKVV